MYRNHFIYFIYLWVYGYDFVVYGKYFWEYEGILNLQSLGPDDTVRLVINRQFCMVCFFSCGNHFQFFETFDIQNLSDKLNSHEPGLLNLSDRFFVTIIFQKLQRIFFEWNIFGNGVKKGPIIFGIFFCQNCQNSKNPIFRLKYAKKWSKRNGCKKHSNFLATFFGNKCVPVFLVSSLLCLQRLKKTFRSRETDLFQLKFLFIYS